MTMVGITDIIRGIPLRPSVRTTPKDTPPKSKIHLLNRVKNDRGERLDVLMTPDSEDLALSGNVYTYISFRQDGKTPFYDAVEGVAKLHEIEDDSFYWTIKGNEREIVLPWKIRRPELVRDSTHIRTLILECNENIIDRFIEMTEKWYDLNEDIDERIVKAKEKRGYIRGVWDSGKVLFGEVTKEFQEIQEKFWGEYSSMFNPLQGYLCEQFGEERPNTTLLTLMERHPEHHVLKSVGDKYYNPPQKGKIRTIMNRWVYPLILAPLKYAVFSSSENEIFSIPKSVREAEEMKEYIEYFKKRSRKTVDLLTKENELQKKIAKTMYHWYLGIGSAVAFAAQACAAASTGHVLSLESYRGTGSLAAGAMLAGLLAELYISNRNYHRTGQPTGLIGTLRDTVGWTKDYPSPWKG